MYCQPVPTSLTRGGHDGEGRRPTDPGPGGKPSCGPTASGLTGDFPAARLAPDFFRYVAETAFGTIWSRPGLAIRDRSLVTVAQLAALGRTEELRAHLAGALNVGISRTELVEVLMQTAVYAGVPAANQAWPPPTSSANPSRTEPQTAWSWDALAGPMTRERSLAPSGYAPGPIR
ncbi:MAG: carboxymuconolactone decarboxylase family protein [Acidimicrobiales bacterium]